MIPSASIGKVLIVMGVVLALTGVFITTIGRLPRLPGDIIIERTNVRVYAPIATMILVSIVLTIVLNILARR